MGSLAPADAEEGRLLKTQGIRARWILNGIAIVLAIVIVAVLAFSVSVSSYYYDSVQNGLETKAQIGRAHV